MTSMYRTTIVPHPEFGFWFVPNQYAQVPHPDRGQYIIQTNSLGIRSNREYTHEKPASRYRILIFGDSLTAADGVCNSERFSDVLESLDSRLEVINFGLPASGVDQQLLIFERMAQKFEFDMLLLCPYVGDIQRNVMRYRAVVDRNSGEVVFIPKPYFTLEGDELVSHHLPVPEERIPLKEASDEVKRTAIPTTGVNYGRTPLGRFVTTLDRTTGGATSTLIKVATRILRSNVDSHPHPEYDSPMHPAWRLMRAILDRFVAHVGQGKVVLAPLPSYHYIESQNEQPDYLRRFQEFERQTPKTHLLNVLAWFHCQPQSTRRGLRFPNDLHYTPEAHMIVGKTLYTAHIKGVVDAAFDEVR